MYVKIKYILNKIAQQGTSEDFIYYTVYFLLFKNFKSKTKQKKTGREFFISFFSTRIQLITTRISIKQKQKQLIIYFSLSLLVCKRIYIYTYINTGIDL